jgi:DNA-directed RNA polymerase subunit RPC12/RpoP
MIRFRCKTCGKKLKADEQIVGRRVRCTKCDSIEIVPKGDVTNSKSLGESPSGSGKELGDADVNPVEIEVPSKVGDFEFSMPSLKTSSEKRSGEKQTKSGNQDFTPHFQLATKKVSRTRRVVLFGMIGGFLIVSVLVAANFARLAKARKMLSTDYDELAEVVYYRNARKKLEKSYRMMDIAGQLYLANNPSDQSKAKEFEQAKSATLSRTLNSDLEKEVESYFQQGEDMKAKALLVNTAVELDAWRKEIDLKTKFFSEASY